MADLKQDARSEMAPKFNCTRCYDSELSAAPNDAMPNPSEYDFRCTCGRLFDLSDVVDQ